MLLTNLDMNKVIPLIQLRQQLRSCNDASEAIQIASDAII